MRKSLLKSTVSNSVIGLSLLTLAACGGGGAGGGGGGGGGATIVAPPPPVVPTTLQNMTGTRNFSAASVSIAGRNNDADIFLSKEIDTNSTIIFDNNTNQLRLIFSTEYTNNEPFNLDQTFDLDTDVLRSSNGIMVLGKYISADHAMLVFYSDPDEAIAGLGNLNYVTGGLWMIADDNSLDVEVGYAGGGFETADADMPTTGTANYDIVADGVIAGMGGVYEGIGTGNLNVSFATGDMDGNVPTIDLYDLVSTDYISTEPGFSLDGSITGNTGDFTGTTFRAAQGGDPELNGEFAGRFFGPSAEEIGGVFQMDSGGTNQVTNLFIVGGFLGKQ